MRTSRDDYKDGLTYNGYDYDLQVWVMDGVVIDCSHPSYMRGECASYCNARIWAGHKLADVIKAVA